MKPSLTVDAFVNRLRKKAADRHSNGQNSQYRVNDAALAAVAIFLCRVLPFWQANGICNRAGAKQRRNGISDGQIPQIPIRNLLDPVSPAELSDEFRHLMAELYDEGHLRPMAGPG